jgi:hypothetical protein
MNSHEMNRNVTLGAIVAALLALGLWTTCTSRASAQSGHPWPDPFYEAKSDPVQARELTPPEQAGGWGSSNGESANTGSPSPASHNPFASNWLEVEYQLDSREGDSDRILSFEGHSRASENVDVYGSLELMNGIDDDLARFTLRAGVFGRISKVAGLALWYEDFTGSLNERGLIGAYYDVLPGGERPFVRLVGLPIATQDGGVMARAMFDVALHERWSVAGFLEGTWGGEDGSYNAAEPELRYAITKGLWATLEYRRDERWGDDPESLALGMRGAL